MRFHLKDDKIFVYDILRPSTALDQRSDSSTACIKRWVSNKFFSSNLHAIVHSVVRYRFVARYNLVHTKYKISYRFTWFRSDIAQRTEYSTNIGGFLLTAQSFRYHKKYRASWQLTKYTVCACCVWKLLSSKTECIK